MTGRFVITVIEISVPRWSEAHKADICTPNTRDSSQYKNISTEYVMSRLQSAMHTLIFSCE